MAAQREQQLMDLAEYFLALSESEADDLLRSAGVRGGVTPAGWGQKSDAYRRTQIVLILSQQSESLLNGLALATGAGVTKPQWGEPNGALPEPGPAPAPETAADGPIFLVHGHDHAKLHEAVRVLERATGREVIVLHEKANAGKTILEKFEEHAGKASYAVVLLTGDDVGGAAGASKLKPRGRQNVILELGFFFGALGRKHVAVLLDSGVEKPSDIDGLVYIGLDAGGAWKQSLARELQTAGIEVDYSRIP